MDVPPKLVGSEVVRRERGITMHPHSGLLQEGRDSLPVLGAFGEFIESERRRFRNRMLIMAGFFFLILVIVVGAGVLTGMLFFDRVRLDVHNVKTEIAGFREDVDTRYEQARMSMVKYESETRNLIDSLAQQEEALANTRSDVDSQKQDYEQELSDMKQLLNLLEVENTALRKDVRSVTDRLPELSGKVGNLLAAMGGIPSNAVSSHETAQSELPPSFEFSLFPAGGSRTIPWRLPIPE